jgi:hypothetical protein
MAPIHSNFGQRPQSTPDIASGAKLNSGASLKKSCHQPASRRKEHSLVHRFLSLSLILLLTNSLTPLASAPQQEGSTQQPQETVAVKLTNKDVLDMLKAGLSPEIIVAKIKSSPTSFDTSAESLKALKESGTPDAVILAMVQAPAAGATTAALASTADAALVEVKVPDGTEIEIELVNTASGQEVKVGDLVDFKVLHPVEMNGVTVFEKDASARARITTAKKAGRWGKAGKLEWAMQDIQAKDGSRVPARFTQRALGDSKGGTVAVAAVATTVLLGPLGLLWGLKKGKPAIIPAGNRYKVFVHGDTTIKALPAFRTAS